MDIIHFLLSGYSHTFIKKVKTYKGKVIFFFKKRNLLHSDRYKSTLQLHFFKVSFSRFLNFGLSSQGVSWVVEIKFFSGLGHQVRVVEVQILPLGP